MRDLIEQILSEDTVTEDIGKWVRGAIGASMIAGPAYNQYLKAHPDPVATIEVTPNEEQEHDPMNIGVVPISQLTPDRPYNYASAAPKKFMDKWTQQHRRHK